MILIPRNSARARCVVRSKPTPDVLLPDFNELRKQSRYENTVGRQLHRALGELRKIREERHAKKDKAKENRED